MELLPEDDPQQVQEPEIMAELQEEESPYTTKLLMKELTHDIKTGIKISYPENHEREETIDTLNDEVKENLYRYMLAREAHIKSNPENLKHSDQWREMTHNATAESLIKQWPSLFKEDTQKARNYITNILGDAISEETIFVLGKNR